MLLEVRIIGLLHVRKMNIGSGFFRNSVIMKLSVCVFVFYR